jgi:hypothetical protein
VTINLGVSFNEVLNPDLESDFNNNINGDKDRDNENMWFYLVFLILYTIYVVLVFLI